MSEDIRKLRSYDEVRREEAAKWKPLADELAGMVAEEKAAFMNLLIGFTLDSGDSEIPVGEAMRLVRAGQRRAIAVMTELRVDRMGQ